jgi:hypothetical protein
MVHETHRDFPRHFPTKKDEKRHVKTPFHNPNNKQNPKKAHKSDRGAIEKIATEQQHLTSKPTHEIEMGTFLGADATCD